MNIGYLNVYIYNIIYFTFYLKTILYFMYFFITYSDLSICYFYCIKIKKKDAL